MRIDKAGNKTVVLLNFSGRDINGYRLGVEKGKYKVAFNSDSSKFGGSGKIKRTVYNAKKSWSHGKEYSIQFDIPKLTCVYLTKIN